MAIQNTLVPQSTDKHTLTKKGKRRPADWEANHVLIRDAYVALITELKRRPTSREVGERCGLAHETCRTHLKELTFEPLKHPLRILTEDVLLGIYKGAIDGNAASQKLWLQIMEGYRESTPIDTNTVAVTVSDTNFSITVRKAGA